MKQDEINNCLCPRVFSKSISTVRVQHVQCGQHTKVKNNMYVCMYVCDIFICSRGLGAMVPLKNLRLQMVHSRAHSCPNQKWFVGP